MELRVGKGVIFAATGGRPFDPQQPVLVLIHGAGMDHTVWSMQSRYFAHHGYTVMALDLPGHGRSDGPAPDSIPGYAGALAAVLDTAGVTRFSLVGHSMGSLVALDLASRRPDVVQRMALLGTAAHIAVAPPLLDAARRGDHGAFESIIGWGVGRRAHIGGHRSPGNWVAGAGMRLLEAGHRGVLANDLAACDSWTTGCEAASRVACPTLLLLGSDDRMTPARNADPLARALADSRTVVMPSAGHMMMTELPDETLDILAAFFVSA